MNQPLSISELTPSSTARTEQSSSSSVDYTILGAICFPSLVQARAMLPVSHPEWVDVYTGCGGWREHSIQFDSSLQQCKLMDSEPSLWSVKNRPNGRVVMVGFVSLSPIIPGLHNKVSLLQLHKQCCAETWMSVKKTFATNLCVVRDSFVM